MAGAGDDVGWGEEGERQADTAGSGIRVINTRDFIWTGILLTTTSSDLP